MAKRKGGSRPAKSPVTQAHTSQEGSVDQVGGSSAPERDTESRTGQGQAAAGRDGRHEGKKGTRDSLVSSDVLRESGSTPRTRS